MRRFYLDPTIRQLFHGNFVTGMDTEMLQKVFARSDLPLGCDSERVHGISLLETLNVR
jgi:hypothetical protein